MNNFEEENLIARSDLVKHNVQKYEFKTMSKDQDDSTDKALIPQVSMPFVENSNQPGNIDGKKSGNPSLEQDLIERLLQKTDELSSSLAKLQIQFEKQQLEIEERVNTARSDAYKDGIKVGEEKVKKEMLEMVEKERSALIQSAITLDKEMQKSQVHLASLEKELSGIAVDIAREVIVKEIDSSSQKVALSLAKELLGATIDATDVHLRVNTIDYPYLNENLKDTQKIKLEADDAIAKGGVVITSSSGNIDGNIMSRYRALKQSVLDNLKA